MDSHAVDAILWCMSSEIQVFQAKGLTIPMVCTRIPLLENQKKISAPTECRFFPLCRPRKQPCRRESWSLVFIKHY